MTMEEAEKILELDISLRPYSKSYLRKHYKNALKKIKSSSVLDLSTFNSIRQAYDTIKFWTEPIIDDLYYHVKEEYTPEELDMLFDYIVGINSHASSSFHDQAEDIFVTLQLLIPDSSLQREIENMGGLKYILNNRNSRKALANMYGVNLWHIDLRLCEKYVSDAYNDISEWIRIRKIKRKKRNGEFGRKMRYE